MIAAAAAAAAVMAAGSPVGVSLREWAVAPYRDSVRAGTVRLNVENFGEDVHDLAVRRRGRIVARTRELRPGERTRLRVRLRPRRTYVLICTLPGHERAGMRARLRIR